MLKLQEAPVVELEEVDPFSAARCRTYKRLNNKVTHFRKGNKVLITIDVKVTDKNLLKIQLYGPL